MHYTVNEQLGCLIEDYVGAIINVSQHEIVSVGRVRGGGGQGHLPKNIPSLEQGQTALWTRGWSQKPPCRITQAEGGRARQHPRTQTAAASSRTGK